MDKSDSILLISGSLRNNSTNSSLLRTAQLIAPPGHRAVFYEDVGKLPHFNPDIDAGAVPKRVADLRATIRSADAVLFCTPEYAGALPGSFKNLLEWAVGDDHTRSLYGKPVAWINVSQRGAENAHESLRKVLGCLGTVIVESACVRIPVARSDVGGAGLIDSVHIRMLISVSISDLIKSLHPPSQLN